MYESATPYFTFRGLARHLLGIAPGTPTDVAADRIREVLAAVAPDLLPWAPLVALGRRRVNGRHAGDRPAPGRIPGRQARRDRQRSSRAIASRPTLLVIEEAHWMDEASAELLRALVRDLPGRPWFVCVTRRGPGRRLLRARGRRDHDRARAAGSRRDHGAVPPRYGRRTDSAPRAASARRPLGRSPAVPA